MNAGSTERRQRIREQLREFYRDPTAGRDKCSDESGVSGAPPEMDLDSEFFNVGRYVTDLLRRGSLKELVETDTRLLRTVRHLDAELQELVYRDYAKFISATDTIREMRENITEMDAKLQALSGNVEIIDQVSKGISDKLQLHRGRVENMIATNRMLRKVQFLLDLANTMRRLMERQEYGVCVKYWVAGDNFLLKHANLSSIIKIRDECGVLAHQLYRNLHETVLSTSLANPEAIDVIRCVVEDMRLMRATSLFEDKAVENVSAGGNEVLSSFEAEILNALMKNVSGEFSTGVQGVNSAIRSALAVPNFAGMDRARWPEVLEHSHLQEAFVRLKNICALFYSNTERVNSLFRCEKDAAVSLRIVEEVQPVLIDIISPFTTYMSDLLIATVDAICSDGEDALQITSVVGNSLNTVFTTLARQLKYYSSTLKALGANYLDNAHSHQNRQYAVLVDQSVLEIFQKFLVALEAKVTEGGNISGPIASDATSMDPAYRKLLHFSLTRFLFSNAAAAADTMGTTALIDTGALKPADVVEVKKQCAHVARVLAHRGVVLLAQLHLKWVAAACCPTDAVDPTSTAAQNYGVAPCLTELVRQLEKIYVFLRDSAVDTSSHNAGGDSSSETARLPHSVDNPPGFSMPYSNVGSGHSSGRTVSRKPVVTFMRQTGNAMQSSVDRIFSKQSQSNAELQLLPRGLKAASIVLAVVVYLLKGLIEHVRQNAFTRNGFQSVQISCTFFLYVLTPSVVPLSSASSSRNDKPAVSAMGEWLGECKDSSLLKTAPQLLNECCTCAYERCREKVPLTAVVVERLVMSALENMQNSLSSS